MAYRLEIPQGADSITLPESRFVRIISRTVGDKGHALTPQAPLEDLLRDEAFAA